MNVAGRILDRVCLLAQLWQNALLTEQEKMGLESVTNFIRRAITLIGNTFYRALVGQKNGLLGKVFPESIDLIVDTDLFVPD